MKHAETFMTTQIKLFDIVWTNKLTETLGIPRYSLSTSHITDSTGPFFLARRTIQRLGKFFPRVSHGLKLILLVRWISHRIRNPSILGE